MVNWETFPLGASFGILAADRALFVMVALRDAERIVEVEDIVGVFGLGALVPVPGLAGVFGVVVPGGGRVVPGAAEQELDHVALVRRAVGGRTVPEVVVREGDGAGLDR